MVVGPKTASAWGGEAKKSLLAFGELMGLGKSFIERRGGEREGHEKQTNTNKESQKAGGISESTIAMVVRAEGPPPAGVRPACASMPSDGGVVYGAGHGGARKL